MFELVSYTKIVSIRKMFGTKFDHFLITGWAEKLYESIFLFLINMLKVLQFSLCELKSELSCFNPR